MKETSNVYVIHTNTFRVLDQDFRIAKIGVGDKARIRLWENRGWTVDAVLPVGDKRLAERIEQAAIAQVRAAGYDQAILDGGFDGNTETLSGAGLAVALDAAKAQYDAARDEIDAVASESRDTTPFVTDVHAELRRVYLMWEVEHRCASELARGWKAAHQAEPHRSMVVPHTGAVSLPTTSASAKVWVAVARVFSVDPHIDLAAAFRAARAVYSGGMTKKGDNALGHIHDWKFSDRSPGTKVVAAWQRMAREAAGNYGV